MNTKELVESGKGSVEASDKLLTELQEFVNKNPMLAPHLQHIANGIGRELNNLESVFEQQEQAPICPAVKETTVITFPKMA